MIHRVADPDQAAAFLTRLLDFRERSRGPGWVLVENGALSLRLVAPGRASGLESHPLELELVTEDVAESFAFFQERASLEPLTGEVYAEEDRIERRLTPRHGVALVLARKLTEVDNGLLPRLATRLDWDPEAEELVAEILRLVPLALRCGAYRRVTERSECLAMEDGGRRVTQRYGIRGLIQTNPRLYQGEISHELRRRGIDLGLYQEDFEVEGSSSRNEPPPDDPA